MGVTSGNGNMPRDMGRRVLSGGDDLTVVGSCSTCSAHTRPTSPLRETTPIAWLRMPWIGGASTWLNAEPLASAELHGPVVLRDYRTTTCINRSGARTSP